MITDSNSSISKFVPQSHFFTDPAAFTQSADQAFGPVSDTMFRLTSKFSTASATAMAYAVCTGSVLVQPQTSAPDKVNLILRPFKQPIQGLNIKYFVYRGLQKADFFSGTNVSNSTATSSDFVKKVNESFLAYYMAIDPDAALPDFQTKLIGYDPDQQADSMLLDSLFFKSSLNVDSSGKVTEDENLIFELPIIQLGDTLGHFSMGECGLDVVLSYGDYQLPAPNDEFVFDLAYARAAEASISLDTVTNAFQQKLKREQIFQFIDAAAYFGFHYADGGWVKVDNAGTKVNKTADQIYNEVIQNFATKNSIYLYIQNDRTRSYNFYGNYFLDDNSSSLMLGHSENALTVQPYATTGWPLLIDSQPQTHDSSRNTLCLQLVTDNNENAMLYGQVAQVDNAQKNNFIDAKNLQQTTDGGSTTAGLTKTIILSNPAVSTGSNRVNVATFNILLYQGKVYSYADSATDDSENTDTPVTLTSNFLNDIFDHLNAAPVVAADASIGFSTVISQKLKLVNQQNDDDVQYGVAAVQTTIVNDTIDTGVTGTPTLARVTYITEPIDILNYPTSVNNTVSANTKSSPSAAGLTTNSKTYQLPDPFYYTITPFTDSNELINGLELTSTENSISNKIIVGISQAENETLTALIAANNLSNARLCLIDAFEGADSLVSVENTVYQVYNAVIAGETQAATLQLFAPDQNVVIYSTDTKFYYSQAYSAYMQPDTANSTLYLNLNVSFS